MTFGNVSRVGQRNGAGDNQANFPRIFKSAVINAFFRECIIKDRHRIETGEGKAITITSRGLSEAKTRTQAEINDPFTPSAKVIGQQGILVEDYRYSMTAIADWDQAQRMEQYFEDLTFDTGNALARQWDQALLLQIMKGAQMGSSELNSTFDTGAQVSVTVAGSGVGAKKTAITGPQLTKAIVELSAMYDENELDASLSRYLTLTPTNQAKLITEISATVQNPIYTEVGGMGSIADKDLKKVGAMMLLPSTLITGLDANIAAGNTTWGTSLWKNSHVSNNEAVVAASWTPEGVATAIWNDLSVKVHGGNEGDAYTDVMGRGYALAKMLYGCKHLRESCCGVIKVA